MRSHLFSFVLVLTLTSLLGCKALLTGLVMIRGTDVQPEFPILLKGEVSAVVICRMVDSMASRSAGVSQELMERVTFLLDTNIKNKRCEIVQSQAVEAWLDQHDNEPWMMIDVGKSGATKADIVIGIEIQGFRVRDTQSPHLYQGTAQILVTATEVESGKVVARKTLRIKDPPDIPVPASSVSEAAFRSSFVNVVATEIAAHFHPHDPNRIHRIQADSMEMY
ncbi:MAG: hypothetical protein ACRC46_06770 [Thermoguttaceae bacterium]